VFVFGLAFPMSLFMSLISEQRHNVRVQMFLYCIELEWRSSPLFKHLLLLLQYRRRSSHLGKLVVEDSILMGSSVYALRTNKVLSKWFSIFCDIEFLTFLLLQHVVILWLKSDLRLSQCVVILFSNVQWFVPKDVFIFILLSFKPILVLVNSSSYKLLIITLIGWYLILRWYLLWQDLVNGAFCIFLLGQ
jgi:hypothetical protein